MPIFRRELVAAARRGQLQSERAYFAAALLGIVLGTFGVWYYLEGWHASHHLMAGVAFQAFLLIVAVHGLLVVGGATTTAVALAGEKDRRTLDFLLATRLGNAEIVLGKITACLTRMLMTIGAGVPVLLLLNLLGGVDARLILLAYAGIATTTFFVAALAIWISSGAPDARRANSVSVLCVITWLLVPFLVSMFVPRLGLPLPGALMTANAWVLASSPLSLVVKFVPGGGSGASIALLDTVAWMGGLQMAVGIILLSGTVARLRSGYRVNLGGDGLALGAARKRPYWRFRPRPAVGDDPILWREIYTSRGGILGKLFGLLCVSAPCAVLAYSTFFFGRRAFAELWKNGYFAGITTAEKPEFNLMLRFFFVEPSSSVLVDLARTDFNLFLRSVTTPIVFLLALMTAGIAAEAVSSERIRETWYSLISTPFSARDILRSKLLASLWRIRGLLLTLVFLWTLGLLAGSIHPLGYLLSAFELAAWTWLLLVIGLRASVRARDPTLAANGSLSLLFLPLASGVLPFVLPARLSSVLLGTGSVPFVTWLSLVSYRDVRAALRYPVYPHLAWAGIATNEGWLAVLATCVLGVLLPAVTGYFGWRNLLANFDRLIGRPCLKNER
jgi:ABC-type transport system involved in multi-copper enzyme maturation permease subunit